VAWLRRRTIPYTPVETIEPGAVQGAAPPAHAGGRG
jgi:hypothetical protein